MILSYFKQYRVLILLLVVCLTISSCSSYLNKIYSGFDRNQTRHFKAKHSKNNFDFYRNPRLRGRNNPTTSNNRRLPPQIRRNYRKKSEIKKRYRDYDLNDNGSSGSLWIDATGSANQLFTQENRRKIGNIVVINVFKNLKNEITAELKRAFPKRRKTISKKADTPKGEAPKAEKSPTENSNGATSSSKGIVDKISSIIVEEINRKHILLRGQKSILFNKRKHLVEIQALVSRRDISLDDTVNSTQILENEINIIR